MDARLYADAFLGSSVAIALCFVTRLVGTAIAATWVGGLDRKSAYAPHGRPLRAIFAGVVQSVSVLWTTVTTVVGLIVSNYAIMALVMFCFVLGVVITEFHPVIIKQADFVYESIQPVALAPVREISNGVRVVLDMLMPLYIAFSHLMSVPVTALLQVVSDCDQGGSIVTKVLLTVADLIASLATAVVKWAFTAKLAAPLDLTPVSSDIRTLGQIALNVSKCSCSATSGLTDAVFDFMNNNQTDVAVSEAANFLLSIVQTPINATIQAFSGVQDARISIDYPLDRLRGAVGATAAVLNSETAAIVKAVNPSFSWDPVPFWSVPASIINIIIEFMRGFLGAIINIDLFFTNPVRASKIVQANSMWKDIETFLDVLFVQVIGGLSNYLQPWGAAFKSIYSAFAGWVRWIQWVSIHLSNPSGVGPVSNPFASLGPCASTKAPPLVGGDVWAVLYAALSNFKLWVTTPTLALGQNLAQALGSQNIAVANFISYGFGWIAQAQYSTLARGVYMASVSRTRSPISQARAHAILIDC